MINGISPVKLTQDRESKDRTLGRAKDKDRVTPA